MILVFGSINVDLVARVATIPGPGKTVLAPSYDRHFGGKGANQAVAAARLSATGRVAIAACVGDDGFGREVDRQPRRQWRCGRSDPHRHGPDRLCVHHGRCAR